MRRNELTIGVCVALIALAVGFWVLVLGPKRQEASDLKGEVDNLQSQVEQAQQDAAAGQQARKSFPIDYRKLVVLGKAVPQDADQSSLLVQLQKLADRSGIEFQSINLSDATGSATSTAPTSTTLSSSSTTSTTSTSGSTSTSSASPTSEPTVPATEASAATLPIGASVGPAGLPVMGYDLQFNGGFFQIADFLDRVDGMVRTKRGAVVVDGRLLTVDAFSLAPMAEAQTPSPVPTLTADLSVTTYLTPADQGTIAGATPTGPAPLGSTSTTPTPASSTTPPPTAPSTSTSTSTTTP